MLYTIISEYDIFAQELCQSQTKWMDISGGKVEYTEENGEKIVRRLFSTDPKMYLLERYYPYSSAEQNIKI